jgi:hypothetical protein
VTASGSGSVAATIAAGAVTTSKIAAGNITTALIAALNVTTATIAANAITYAKIQTQADQTILGNVSGGVAVPSALTAGQVDAMLFGALATGILAVTATTGVVSSNVLTSTDVLYATGANTIGQNSSFQFNSGTTTLSVPTVSAVGAGSLTLKTAAVTLLLNNGPTTAQLTGGLEPSADVTYNLGSSSARWNFAHAANIRTDTIYGNSTTLDLFNAFSGFATNINLNATNIVTTGSILPGVSATDNLGSSTKLYNQVWSAETHAVNFKGFVGGTPIGFTDNAGTLMMSFSSGAVTFSSTAWGVFGSNNTQQTVTGSRAGNAALASLLTKLATYGIIVDGSSA